MLTASRVVTVVSLMECLVYTIDNSALIDITFAITSCNVSLLTGAFSYQTRSSGWTFFFGHCHKCIPFFVEPWDMKLEDLDRKCRNISNNKYWTVCYNCCVSFENYGHFGDFICVVKLLLTRQSIDLPLIGFVGIIACVIFICFVYLLIDVMQVGLLICCFSKHIYCHFSQILPSTITEVIDDVKHMSDCSHEWLFTWVVDEKGDYKIGMLQQIWMWACMLPRELIWEWRGGSCSKQGMTQDSLTHRANWKAQLIKPFPRVPYNFAIKGTVYCIISSGKVLRMVDLIVS